ncbi:tetratricopeptide repeat protein [Streptomyces sp. R35]|uniref:Tetratricopeptide repeat protein n=1 Tax=Streptomyces sp. R35 TaxID=3238630 RepID=A0AB39SFT6_9ACTN
MDERLRHRIRDGGFVVLLGDSAAGKSRAAVEAIRATVPEHVLISPLTRAGVKAAVVATGEHQRWVLWLDDLKRFLGPDGLTRALVLQLLAEAGPDHLVLATMRAIEHLRYLEAAHPRESATGGNVSEEHAAVEQAQDVRDLLEHADLIRVDRILSETELRNALAYADDLRIADAIEHAQRYGLAEYLAAGPECLAIWHNAWQSGGHLRGAALVATAVDARRAGITVGLPRTLLERLHGYYLQRHRGAALRPEPLNEAWDWATRPRLGTTGLLMPTTSENHVDVFDYLVDDVERSERADRDIPAELLTALLAIADPTEMTRIAATASEFGHHEVELQAHRHAYDRRRVLLGVDHPDTVSSKHSVAFCLLSLGRLDESRPVWRGLIETYTRTLGTEHALVLRSRQGLANTLEPGSKERELRRICREYGHTLGPEHPWVISCHRNLVETLEDLGRHDEAMTERQRALHDLQQAHESMPGEPVNASHQIAFLLTQLGQLDAAEDKWREVLHRYLAELGTDHALTLRARHGLAWVEAERGLIHQARRSLQLLTEDYLRVLGPDHPWTQSCVDHLARIETS